MNIVHIITRLIVGGAQENTLLSCEGQHDLGHQVTLITGPPLGPEGSLLKRAQAYGYRVEIVDAMRRAISIRRDFQTYRALRNLIRRLSPDVVHTHSSKAGILGRRAAYAAGARSIVHTIHGLAFTASTSAIVNTAYRLLEKHTAPITDRIICVADAMAEQSLAGGVGKRGQYVTVYSGMAIDPFINSFHTRDEVRTRLGIQPSHVVVGTIARLFDLKGHDDLLAFAPALCARFPELRFLWVGDGSRRADFETQMRQLNLRDRFILTGLVTPEEVPALTGAMDILVHPSRREGLARALPQAQLARKPVVTYDIDGNREGLLDRISGYVLPPFDRTKLSEALATLIADAPQRQAMGEAGQAFARQRFAASAMVAGLEKVYQDVLRGKSQKRA